ncbi:translocation/assembly module TamB domain-containing protein [Sulfurimonas sp.]|uniref:translocation/assembly module TamB domain-containing protein n=1 Tax=Sulfurimonas sp. TaxID=2022749 RepID=UPI00262AEE2E|nr:translocation/assembly module TamB domain-containing protein [Sulfurimonas sp.]MDD5157000.1 translocation/assembly module TamB domain-containing protein [Sulfurimonas sp.]
MKYLYLFPRFITLVSLTILGAIFFLLFSKSIVPYLAKEYSKDFGIEYKTIKGTIFDGFIVDEFRYKNEVSIGVLKVEYNFLSLLSPTPTLKKIEAEGVALDIDEIQKDKTKTKIIAFNISKLTVKSAKAIFHSNEYLFDLNGSKINYRDENVDMATISSNLKTPQANAYINGHIKSNNIIVDADAELSKDITDKYLYFIKVVPKRLNARVDITKDRVILTTKLKDIAINSEQNISISNTDINLSYFIKKDNFYLKTKYNLSYNEHRAKIKQEVSFNTKKEYSSNVDLSITSQLPQYLLRNIKITINGNVKKHTANISVGNTKAKLSTVDFKDFLFDLDWLHFSATGSLIKNGDELSLNSIIFPKKDSRFLKNIDIKKLLPITLSAHRKNKTTMLKIDANIFNIALNEKSAKIEGSGNLGASRFALLGDLNSKTLEIRSKARSLKKFLTIFGVEQNSKELEYEASLEAQATLYFGDKLAVKGRVDVPFYRVKMKDDEKYSGDNGFFEFSFVEGELSIDRYDFMVRDYKIYSNKKSKILIDSQNNLELVEFYLFDNLLIRGTISPSKKIADLELKSDGYHYRKKDIDITLKADLKGSFNANGKQDISGDITILDGEISYVLQNDYKISDEDIIIIQDLKEKKTNTNRTLNIHIDSAKPIRYKVKGIDLLFKPDIVVYQNDTKGVQFFGIISINSGKVKVEDNIFEFDKSEIYLYGERPLNPHLNLTLHFQTPDSKEIEIYITNTMSSPVILFSSKPTMSQNDIISYILFGEASSELFNNNEKNTNKISLNTLFLGTGLKNMLSEKTGVRVDTLSILTNKTGNLGYEIGARFNKDFRLVYKNNTISSIIIQYNLRKSLRFDVEVDENDQGVSIVYVKDF